MMTEDQYTLLRDDIKEHGQCEDIVVWKGLLIDGRNRLRACEELGVEPQIAELMEEADPVAYVISHNLHRRHLTAAQRAMIATKLAALRHGDVKSQTDDSTIVLSQSEAANKLSVSVGSVKRARKVQAEAKPEVVAAVEAGEMSLNAALATTQPTDAAKQERAKAKAAKDKEAANPLMNATFADCLEVVEMKVDQTDQKACKAAAKQLRKLADKLDPPTKFVKPDLDDVTEFMESVDPQYGTAAEDFHDHYESNGWMVGKVPMKDWKATARKWLRNQGQFSNGKAASNGREQQREQRNADSFAFFERAAEDAALLD